jgi:hypothetical protein
MSTTDYNGWTNYATWRVNLEIFSNVVWSDHVTAEELQEWLDEYLFSNCAKDGANSVLVDYAKAFLSDVNYYEIARYINEEIDLQSEYENK